MRLVILLLFVSLTGLVQRGVAQPPRFIIGKVLDLETGKGVNNASVINQRSRAVGRTNTLGAYYLEVKPGDSVVITSPSHGRLAFNWDGQTKNPTLTLKRQLSDDIINLPELTVRAKRESEVRRELEQILREPEARKGLTGDQILSLAQSPITLLYELFSKQARSSRKALVIAQQHRKHMLAYYRLELITLRATELKGEDVDRFKEFCEFSDDFLLQSSEYELTYSILQRYKQFLAGH